MVNAKIIFLLTTDVKNRRLIGVSKETMVEALKSLKITLKVLECLTSKCYMGQVIRHKQDVFQSCEYGYRIVQGRDPLSFQLLYL